MSILKTKNNGRNSWSCKGHLDGAGLVGMSMILGQKVARFLRLTFQN